MVYVISIDTSKANIVPAEKPIGICDTNSLRAAAYGVLHETSQGFLSRTERVCLIAKERKEIENAL